jgi:hypothetical protein
MDAATLTMLTEIREALEADLSIEESEDVVRLAMATHKELRPILAALKKVSEKLRQKVTGG